MDFSDEGRVVFDIFQNSLIRKNYLIIENLFLFFFKSTKEGGLNQSKRILSQKNWGIHNSGSEFWSKSIKKYLVEFAPKECQLMRILLTLMMMINDDDNCSYDCVDVFNDQADGILLMTDSKISFHDCHL